MGLFILAINLLHQQISSKNKNMHFQSNQGQNAIHLDVAKNRCSTSQHHFLNLYHFLIALILPNVKTNLNHTS